MAAMGFKIRDKRIQRISRDIAMCEKFKWTLNELYQQPSRRIREFEMVLAERDKIALNNTNK